MKDLKWFAGHMKNALDDIEESKIKLVDACLYVLDSRAPYSCLNPKVERIVHNKPLIYVFNKIDLADGKRLGEIQKEFEREGKTTISLVASDKNFAGKLRAAIKSTLSAKIERNAEKNIRKTYKILVLGVPNTGKSSLINMLSSSKKANTGNIAGVTRKNQWVKVDDDLMILDTPGVLWPKFDEAISKNLAYIGCLADNELNLSDLGFELMQVIHEKYPGRIAERFGVSEECEEFIELYDKLCKKRGYILKGGELDYERAGKSFVDEVRNGKLGGITLD